MATKAKKGSARIPNPYIAFCQQYRAAHSKQFQTLSVPDQGRELGKAWRNAHTQQHAQRVARSYRSAAEKKGIGKNGGRPIIHGMDIKDFNSGGHYLRDSYKYGVHGKSDDDRIRNVTLRTLKETSNGRVTLQDLASNIEKTKKELVHTIALFKTGQSGFDVRLTGLLMMCNLRFLIADGKIISEDKKQRPEPDPNKISYPKKIVQNVPGGHATFYFGIDDKVLFQSEVFGFDQVYGAPKKDLKVSKISKSSIDELLRNSKVAKSNLTLLADVASHKARLVES